MFSVNDQGFQRNDTVVEALPPTVLPSTHWNLNQVKQSMLASSSSSPEAGSAVSSAGVFGKRPLPTWQPAQVKRGELWWVPQ